MKISPPVSIANTLRSNSAPTAENQADGQGFQNAYEDQFQDKEKDAPEHGVTEPEVREAIDELEAQSSLKDQELSASFEGHGPGLRVTLKDGRGAVVRQLSGSEFVALQQESHGAPIGRLFDKKI
jgi:hypothetical protein